MKILLLGAGGMLGNELATQLADQELIVGDLPDFDITDYQALEEKIKAIKPEVIINAAGFTNVDACETAVDLCNKVNGDAVGNLALLAKQFSAILVHFSTDYVFDGLVLDGYKEDAIPDPINVYAQSKLLGEQLMQKNCSDYYLIRTAWLYGAHGTNFINKILDLAKTQPVLQIVNDQFGNPTYAVDLAIAIKSILLEKLPFGIYHRTNNGKASWYDYALKIKELCGLGVKIEPVSSQQYATTAKRPANTALVSTKLPPMRDWQEALKDYLSKNHL